MFCPKCGEVMIVNDGEVTCVSGGMQLSASMRDGLTEVFVDRSIFMGAPQPSRTCSPRCSGSSPGRQMTTAAWSRLSV